MREKLFVDYAFIFACEAWRRRSVVSWPAPIDKVFSVPDVSKANISLHIKARDERDLYTLQRHSAGYAGDSDFNWSGDFECRLSLSNSENVYSTLLTEDLNQSRDWESRGRFFAASLRGECARIPEFGSVRNLYRASSQDINPSKLQTLEVFRRFG